MAITINSPDLYNEQAVALASTGVVVDYTSEAVSASESVRVKLTIYANTFAKNNNFVPLRRLYYAPAPPEFQKINMNFSVSLTPTQYNTYVTGDVETYIQTYLENILGASTVVIS